MSSNDFNAISFPQSISVTDMEIDLRKLTEIQKNYYKNFLTQLLDLYTKKNQKRLLVGLSGPSGSGKSVMVFLMRELIEQIEKPFHFEVLGQDAFHYTNEYLNSHVDEQGFSLNEHKGRFDTFDTDLFSSKLEQFKANKKVRLPRYSRKIHAPVADVVCVDDGPALLLVEGLWLLHEDSGWASVSKLFDHHYFIETDLQKVEENVIERHMRGGRSREESEEFYKESDQKNNTMVQAHRERADIVIKPYFGA